MVSERILPAATGAYLPGSPFPSINVTSHCVAISGSNPPGKDANSMRIVFDGSASNTSLDITLSGIVLNIISKLFARAERCRSLEIFIELKPFSTAVVTASSFLAKTVTSAYSALSSSPSALPILP